MKLKLTRLRLFGGERVTRFSMLGGVICRFFGGDRLATEKFKLKSFKINVTNVACQPL